jgi:hypothetical protein
MAAVAYHPIEKAKVAKIDESNCKRDEKSQAGFQLGSLDLKIFVSGNVERSVHGLDASQVLASPLPLPTWILIGLAPDRRNLRRDILFSVLVQRVGHRYPSPLAEES